MSEAPAMSRPLGGADEFDRRLRMTGRSPVGEDDPLAELARLVGQDDPFKRMFPKAAPTRERAEPAFVATPSQTAVASDSPAAVAAGHSVEGFAAFEHDIDDGFAPVDEGAAAHAPPVRRYDPRSYPVEPSPDAWAQGDDSTDEDESPVTTVQEKPASTGRTLVVLVAVIVLTGGGLAASFLARPSSVSASAAPPTILAVAGPAKVQPPAPSSADEGQSEPSTLLDKNKSDGTATAKVVDSVEQPVDLSQAVRPAPDAPDASNPFPTPRKVKTVMVRPDGTVLASGPDAPAPAAATPDVTEASLAFDSHTAIPMPDRSAPPAAAAPDGSTASIPTEAPPAPAPLPKVTARAAPPVRTPPAQMAARDDTADTAPAPVKPKPPATSTRVRSKSKPIEEASLTTVPDSDAPAATAGSGNYAVQLGAPPSAQEARDASSRLQKKFADQLGSYRPAIHEAKSGDKSVFRIRVGGLSQDDAKALCSKLQSGGGACFVVHN